MKQMYTLTLGDVASLVHHLLGDTVPLDPSGLAEIGVGEAELAIAERELTEAGLLQFSPLDDAAHVTGEIAILLETALFPERLGVLQLFADGDGPSKDLYFSFGDNVIVCNYVDAENQHVFAELEGAEQLPDLLLTTVNQGVFQENIGTMQYGQSAPRDARTRPVAQIMPQVQQMAIWMMIADPSQTDTAVQAISWLQTDTELWLVDGLAAQAVSGYSISVQELRQKIMTMAELSLETIHA